MRNVLIRVEGLTVEFKVPRGVLVALDNVDLDMYEGEVLGLVGESGCGKTVLAHSLLKLIDPNGYFKSGKVIFNGKDILSLGDEDLRRYRWKDVAIVFQGAFNSMNPVMKIFEHMIDTTEAHVKTTKSEVYDKSAKLMEFVRLESNSVLKLYPHEISGGMKQRTGMVISLLLNPKLLILDEPTSALDVLTQKYILKFFRDFHEKTALTMLYITHDIATVCEIAERLAVMYLGDIIETGYVEDIFYNPKHPYTYFLLKAIPSITGKVEDVKPLPGPVPDPVNPPSGCKFHPRCPFAVDICKSVKPKLFGVDDRTYIACHRWAYLRDEGSLRIGG